MPWTGMDNREVARFFLPALEITGPRAEAQEAIGWKGFCFFWGVFFLFFCPPSLPIHSLLNGS